LGIRKAKGAKYDDFYNFVGKQNDYLIFLGDIIDVAIEDYKAETFCFIIHENLSCQS